jgi:hypothetical protein
VDPDAHAVPGSHAVKPKTWLELAVTLPQQSDPAGHVAGVQASSTRELQALAGPHVETPETKAQHTSGGVQTLGPHGNGLPGTVGMPESKPPLAVPPLPLLELEPAPPLLEVEPAPPLLEVEPSLAPLLEPMPPLLELLELPVASEPLLLVPEVPSGPASPPRSST